MERERPPNPMLRDIRALEWLMIAGAIVAVSTLSALCDIRYHWALSGVVVGGTFGFVATRVRRRLGAGE